MSEETVATWQDRIDSFLTEELAEAFRSVEYELPAVGAASPLSASAQATITCRHATGAPDASYLIQAFGEGLKIQVQLNVWRFVIVYEVPQSTDLDIEMMQARLRRWQTGAEHAGWQIGWRASTLEGAKSRATHIYCYATASKDVLIDVREKLYWRTDIVQMTRALILEAKQVGIRLAG